MDPTLHNRFLGVASFSFGSSASSDGNGDELNENDVIWTSDFTAKQSSVQSSSSSSTTTNDDNKDSQSFNHRRSRASLPRNSGILAALLEPNQQSVLYRKPSLPAYSSSKSISWIPNPPKSEREYASQSTPTAGKVNESAPINVPLLSIAMAKQRNSKFREDEGDEGHEILARGSRRSPKTAFSVLEGVGRTLKGRDLRQVRNAVWRQTGFLD